MPFYLTPILGIIAIPGLTAARFQALNHSPRLAYVLVIPVSLNFLAQPVALICIVIVLSFLNPRRVRLSIVQSCQIMASLLIISATLVGTTIHHPAHPRAGVEVGEFLYLRVKNGTGLRLYKLTQRYTTNLVHGIKSSRPSTTLRFDIDSMSGEIDSPRSWKNRITFLIQGHDNAFVVANRFLKYSLRHTQETKSVNEFRRFDNLTPRQSRFRGYLFLPKTQDPNGTVVISCSHTRNPKTHKNCHIRADLPDGRLIRFSIFENEVPAWKDYYQRAWTLIQSFDYEGPIPRTRNQKIFEWLLAFFSRFDGVTPNASPESINL